MFWFLWSLCALDLVRRIDLARLDMKIARERSIKLRRMVRDQYRAGTFDLN